MKIVVMKDEGGKFVSSCKLSDCNAQMRYLLLNGKVMSESPNGKYYSAELVNEDEIND